MIHAELQLDSVRCFLSFRRVEAGIVDQDVQPIEPLPELRRGGPIEANEARSQTRSSTFGISGSGPNIGDGRLALRLVPAEDDHRCAGLRQRRRRGPPDSGVPAGDKHDCVFFHIGFPSAAKILRMGSDINGIALTPGRALHVYRDNAGLTLAALSSKTGIPVPHFSEWSTDKRPIGKVNARRLAAALDLRLQTVFKPTINSGF